MKIRVYVHTNKVGSKCEDTIEVPDDEIKGMDEKELNEYLESMARDVINNWMDWGWRIIEESD